LLFNQTLETDIVCAPTYLESDEHDHLFAHLAVCRASCGLWMIYVSGHAGLAELSKWSVFIRLRNSDDQHPSRHEYRLCRMNPRMEQEVNVLWKLSAILLYDKDIRQMMSGEKLFHYDIELFKTSDAFSIL
jgi:hypothetical protein